MNFAGKSRYVINPDRLRCSFLPLKKKRTPVRRPRSDPALSDLLTASMLANSLCFVPLTVAWMMPTGNADCLAEFQPNLIVGINTVEQFNGDNHETC